MGPRAAAAIEKILHGAVRALLEQGAAKMTMSDVCKSAGVSRGTLYRYFPTKEKLLDAVTTHLRVQFDARIKVAIADHLRPEDRLRAFMNFLGEYLDSGNPHRFLEVEPEFALRYYRQYLPYFIKITQNVLSPVFDSWEEKACMTLDRSLMTEFLVRFMLSDLLVPIGPNRRKLLERLMKLLADIGAH
jgi:AcrR family transcriptional regulator